MFQIFLLIGAYARRPSVSRDPVDLDAGICYGFECASLPDNYCVMTANSTTFHVSECASGQYCNFGSEPRIGYNYTCAEVTPVHKFSYPGEPCSNQSECLEGDCISGKCEGKVEG